jgi:hypothetical protein
MRALVFTLMCIAAAAAAGAATIYKWVDENGVTHYSDQPHPGAQKIQVQAAQTYKAQAVPRTPAYATRNGAAAGPVYSACVVTRPESEEMFQNTQTVPASVHVEPGLRAGDRVSVLLDGAPAASNVPLDSEFALTSVYRGAHALSVKVEDATGAVVCQSPSVPFNVRQASLLAPNAPAGTNPPAPNSPLGPNPPVMRPR